MKIKVTQDHIDAAAFLDGTFLFANGECCPIALAMSCQGFPDCFVETKRVCLSGIKAGKFSDGIDMPMIACRFVTKFDQGKLVKPFNFDLDV